jgi:proteasome lid subunit RPN8/RPN11
MNISGINRQLLEDLLYLGMNSSDEEGRPVEFAGFLMEKDGIIDEIYLLPGTRSGDSFANVFMEMMPLDTHMAGSAHSHPNGVLRPSAADLNFFPKSGNVHIIVGPPYDIDGLKSWRCFSSDGTPRDIEVIE